MQQFWCYGDAQLCGDVTQSRGYRDGPRCRRGLNVLVAVTDGRLQIASRLRIFCLLTSRADCRMYGRFDRVSAGLPTFRPSIFISVWSQFTHDQLTVHRGNAEIS